MLVSSKDAGMQMSERNLYSEDVQIRIRWAECGPKYREAGGNPL
jgi:hypothetical protein